MKAHLPSNSPGERVAREVERERHERTLHDEARAGLADVDDFRTKDARQSNHSAGLKRPEYKR